MPEDEEEYDVTGAIRVGLDIALTLASLYVLWVYLKDEPGVQALSERALAWWTKVTTEGRRVKLRRISPSGRWRRWPRSG